MIDTLILSLSRDNGVIAFHCHLVGYEEVSYFRGQLLFIVWLALLGVILKMKTSISNHFFLWWRGLGRYIWVREREHRARPLLKTNHSETPSHQLTFFTNITVVLGTQVLVPEHALSRTEFCAVFIVLVSTFLGLRGPFPVCKVLTVRPDPVRRILRVKVKASPGTFPWAVCA